MPATDKLTTEQADAVAVMRDGPRGDVPGPFIALLRSPELMLRLQAVGNYLRFGDTVAMTPAVRELVVLIIARHWTQRFEWSRHRGYAVAAGVPEAVCDAIAEGRHPDGLSTQLAATYELVSELLRNHAVSQHTFDRALQELTDQGVVEVIAHAGYYALLAMVMNAAGTPYPRNVGLSSLP